MARIRLAIVACLAAVAVIAAQAPADGRLQGQLRQLFPAAKAFSPRQGDPPHFRAYADAAQQKLAGFAFWTTDLVPLERGYDGPIKILVGMDVQGVLTGIVVAQHNEPYGYFSVDLPEFAAQFKGKSIRAPFKVGEDIDAISRASISVTSASRAVRNSARRIARQFLSPEVVK